MFLLKLSLFAIAQLFELSQDIPIIHGVMVSNGSYFPWPIRLHFRFFGVLRLKYIRVAQVMEKEIICAFNMQYAK